MFFKGFWANTVDPPEFDATCADMAKTGAEIILPYSGTYSRDDIARFVEAAHSHGLEFHAWTMNNMVGKGIPDEFVGGHRDWLAVNRNEQSGIEFPLWGRQTWWCPNCREYQDWYIERWNGLLAGRGADGLHLDFIRYPDIWDYKDGRAIERPEIPDYSFCYCPRCRREFRDETGVDPLDVPLDPGDEMYARWTRWRMDRVTGSVRRIRAGLDPGLELSAAVFPTPDIARAVVLQDWPQFADQLDLVCTMIYAQKQWGRPITWVKQATEEGLAEMRGKCAYYAGFGHPMSQQTPEELRAGIRAAKEGGADGVVLFHYQGASLEQKEAIAREEWERRCPHRLRGR